MLKLLHILFIAALLAVGCSPNSETAEVDHTSISTSTPGAPSVGVDVGDIAPDVELVSPDGSVHHLSDYRGKVVFLNFWATWCGPCRAEMPSMEKMYQELKDDDFVILAVDVKESKEQVEKFFEEFQLTFLVFLDRNGSVYQEFNKTNGIPQTYIIDKEGVIRDHVPGARNYDNIGPRQIILKLLRE